MAAGDIAEKIARGVISLIQPQDRSTILPRVIAILTKEYEKHARQSEVISAVKLDAGTIQKIEKSLSKKFGEAVTVKNIVDESILGGMIIKFRDMVIDRSVKHQLEEIKQQAHEY